MIFVLNIYVVFGWMFVLYKIMFLWIFFLWMCFFFGLMAKFVVFFWLIVLIVICLFWMFFICIGVNVLWLLGLSNIDVCVVIFLFMMRLFIIVSIFCILKDLFKCISAWLFLSGLNVCLFGMWFKNIFIRLSFSFVMYDVWNIGVIMLLVMFFIDVMISMLSRTRMGVLCTFGRLSIFIRVFSVVILFFLFVMLILVMMMKKGIFKLSIIDKCFCVMFMILFLFAFTYMSAKLGSDLVMLCIVVCKYFLCLYKLLKCMIFDDVV